MQSETKKRKLTFLTGFFKFLNLNLIIYTLIATSSCFLAIILIIQSLNKFSLETCKRIAKTFLYFLNLDKRTIYLINSLIFLYLSHEIILQFFKQLTFNSIKTNNVRE